MKRITKELFDYDKEGFMQYLEQLRNNMAERGLTEKILDDILKDDPNLANPPDSIMP